MKIQNTLKDNWSFLSCGHCKYFSPNANMENVFSTCKRIDHKHFKFFTPYFKCYDCGQFTNHVCNDFEPNMLFKYLFENFTGLSDYYGTERPKGNVGLWVDDNKEVVYYVSRKDWDNNTFVDENGELEWIYRQFYKKTKDGFGYKLITEFNKKKHEYEVDE